MRNDPFSSRPAATKKPAGHAQTRSIGKLNALFPPLAGTGAPLGGIGTGGITQASDGRFTRWTLKGGGVAQFDMPANGFLLRVKPEGAAATARALQPQPDTNALSAFSYETEAPAWSALFPIATHTHAPLAGVIAECLSYSPILPGDFDTSCLPVACFKWRLTNTGHHPAEVSLAQTFANLNGWFDSFHETQPVRVAAGVFNTPFQVENGLGVLLDRRQTTTPPPEGSGQWAISLSAPDATLSRTVAFDGTGDGAALWNCFVETGQLPNLDESWASEAGFRETPPHHPTAALAASTELEPGQSIEVLATLVWDLPQITFGQGRPWLRAYTDRWGNDGQQAKALTHHAIAQSNDWLREIDEWHARATLALGDAPHRGGMAINESYFLVDGLTVATSAKGSPDGKAHFGLIECHDYALYNTLDLWIYAAEAVAQFFPEQAASVARDYAAACLADDPQHRHHRWEDSRFPINPIGSVPHDLGGPGEDPFVTPNSYTYRDGTIWKDLNCDMVLCVYREGQAMGRDWRVAQFPAVKAALDHLQHFDRDGDGLIENDGTPDQTFDNIPMKGPSSYCGGLWITALRAGAALAAEAGATQQAQDWSTQADRATVAFRERLISETHLLVDTDGPFSDCCFIEQLFGPFLSRRLGLGDIVTDAQARRSLRTIFERNFLDAGRGEGAISLSGVTERHLAALPHQDDTSFQTAEIQPGFNFSLAAQLECWGLEDEADQLRRALYHQLYEKRNLVFQTPAAFDQGRDTCRAVLNMRPLAAWWMAPADWSLCRR